MAPSDLTTDDEIRAAPSAAQSTATAITCARFRVRLRRYAAELTASLVRWPNRRPCPFALTAIAEIAAGFDFDVADIEVDAAFIPDFERRKITFSLSALQKIEHAAKRVARTIPGADDGFVAQLVDIALQLFLFHELYHICQNAGEFDTIQLIKTAQTSEAVAEFDLLADLAACQAATAIMCSKRGTASPKAFAMSYVTTLTVAYAVGVGAFPPPRERPEKKRRFLGLLFTAAATHAIATETATTDLHVPPGSILAPGILPVIDFSTGIFNAKVLAPEPKMLLPRSLKLPPNLFDAISAPPGTTSAPDLLAVCLEILRAGKLVL